MKDDHKPAQQISTATIDPETFRQMVAERAYCKAEKRGFVSGHELEDWLGAEQEIRNQCFYWFQEAE